MAFVPVPNTAQLDVVMNWDSQIVENVLHYKKATGSPSESDLIAITDAINTYFQEHLLPLMSSTVTLLRVVGKLLDIADGLFYVSTTGLPVAGGGGSAPLPNNVSIAYSWRTINAGRSFRGRTFHIGLMEGQIDGNRLTSAAVTAIGNGYNGLIAAGVDAGWELVVVSKVHDKVPRTTGVATEVNAGFFTNNVLDSQRDRLPGRGQ